MRTAVFTDNDFDKVNGVTTTWRAVLGASGSRGVRIYTSGNEGVDLPGYYAAPSVGVGLPWYPEMRVYLPRLDLFMRRLERDDVSLVHVATPGPAGLAGRWLARKLRLPLVGSYHTHLGDYAAASSGSARVGRGLDAWMRWFYGACTTVLVPSSATEHLLLAQGYAPGSLRLWSRGVDTNLFDPARRSAELRRSWHVDARRPAILYAGRLSTEKGLSIVEAIGRKLHTRGVAHCFVFAGDGPMSAQLKRACPDAVFLGMLPHASVATVMASADIFLFPSATDTFGNVVLEAQASGLPVVVSDRGGPAQQVRDGETGIVCRAGDADAFAGAAANLLGDPRRRASMATAARQTALARTWDTALQPLFTAWDDARRGASPERGPALRVPA